MPTSATTVAVAPHPCVSAFEKPNTSANSPNVQVSTPAMSIRARSGGLLLTSRRNATIVVGTAITRLTYRHHRHESTCVRIPPSSSPTAPAPPATAPKIPNAFGQSSVPANVTVRSDSAAGASSAPNTPCVARAATSRPNDCASPPTADAAENPTNPAINAHLRPNRSPTLPPDQQQAPECQRIRGHDPLPALIRKPKRPAAPKATQPSRSSRPTQPSTARHSTTQAPPTDSAHHSRLTSTHPPISANEPDATLTPGRGEPPSPQSGDSPPSPTSRTSNNSSPNASTTPNTPNNADRSTSRPRKTVSPPRLSQTIAGNADSARRTEPPPNPDHIQTPATRPHRSSCGPTQ